MTILILFYFVFYFRISKNNAISCVKGRDYSSSFPVRYVPKKSVKIKESENSVPVKGLERNELRKQPDASGLRTEVSNSGRDVKTSFASHKKFQNHNRMTKNNILLDAAKQGIMFSLACFCIETNLEFSL